MVSVELFDELLGVVTRPSCGFEDEWDQIDAGVSFELFLFFAFGHETRTAAGGGHQLDVTGEGGYNGCIDVIRDAT